MLLSNKAYNVLKWIAQFCLPAAGTLYFTLASIWGFPHGEEVIGTISALTIFLGVILGISTNAYKKASEYDGSLLIDSTNPEKDIYRLELGENLLLLSDKETITLSVKKGQNLSQQ